MIDQDSSQKNATTKTASVYQDLRREITGGRRPPGQELIRRDLVKLYGVSLSTVNQALSWLVQDGLVASPEKQSARVVALTEADSRNDLILREAVECQVARLLAEEASIAVLRNLREDAHALDRWIQSEGPDSSLHLEFHLKMARATGYPSLEDTLKRAGVRVLLTARWLRNQSIPHPPDFHGRLIEVFLERDPARAMEAMRAHLRYDWDGSKRLPPSP